MHSRPALLGLAWAAALAPCAVAQTVGSGAPEAAPVATAVDAFFARLGDPPDLDVVEALVHDARVEDAPTAERLAEELASRGGYASAQGLLDLVRHRDASVRLAALRGIASVAIRRTEGVESVRAALRDADADVRSAACIALGQVGGAGDLPQILEGIASNDERTHGAACRAITTLTGLPWSHEDAARWSAWWNEAKAALPARLDAAIRRIEVGGVVAEVQSARSLLARWTWFDAGKVQGAVKGWLHSTEKRQRTEGYLAAASCRLGDLADDVRKAAHEETDANVVAAARSSAKTLGVAVGTTVLPATLPDVAVLLEDEKDEEDDPSAVATTPVEEAVASAPAEDEAASPAEPTESEISDESPRDPVGIATDGRDLSLCAAGVDSSGKTLQSAAGPVARSLVARRRGGSLQPSSWDPLWPWIGFTVITATIGIALTRLFDRRRGSPR
jgi:hypothetical protein